ncbi:LANO_0D03136g1_1 [Lachancea nothofagi CBS 11611]|uniref:Protein-S-isoprenylcysteine O-methyltransferase n=1 Tax=Lachancea nothofagi CBS 11611 TaxID=1266666 RepID=A0A1G4JF31_9SACH|nr:LANO_0D03136g1_1 [Lachancea nothofagi CBS 11611]
MGAASFDEEYSSLGETEKHADADVGVIIKDKVYPYVQKNPLDVISLTGFYLGAVVGLSLGLLPFTFFKNFNLYLLAVAVFHFLEFYITARYNPGKVTSESYLFNNGRAYAYSHMFAMTETLIECILFPNWKSSFYSKTHCIVSLTGLVLIFFGQYVRTMAMVTAGKSFSHQVKTSQNSDHTLVTNGIYAKIRHPSYFGYFWWALGTQIWLLNPVSFIMFTIVLWKFFNERIRFEEKYLIDFFGKEYIDYSDKVGVGIPFIGMKNR